MSKLSPERGDEKMKKAVDNYPEVLDDSESVLGELWYSLPREVLERIFEYLSHKDLKTVALVCSQWNDVIITSSKLWSTYDAFVKGNMPCTLHEFRRRIRAMTVSAETDRKFLKEILLDKRIKSLTFTGKQDPICNNSRLLANLVSAMESVIFKASGTCEGCWRNNYHLHVFFHKLADGHKIRSLKFCNTNLENIDPEVVGQVLKSIERVELICSGLTTEQIISIFRGFCETKKLKHLTLSYNILRGVGPDLFIAGLKFVTSLDLRRTQLTSNQLTALFSMWNSNEITLNSLEMGGVNLKDVNADHFGNVINKLEVACLWCTKLSNPQLTALFSKITRMTSLTELNIGENNNLSNVEADLLAEAVNKIERVDIARTKLTLQQASAILRQCEKKTKLTYLDMQYNNLDLASLEVSSKIRRNVKVLL